MDPSAPRESAPNAADRAHAILTDRIVSGSLAPGTALSEIGQAAALGMSRTPVREAFLRLSAEGLLRLHTARGAVVTTEDETSTRELLEARVMLESEAVRALTLPPGMRPATDADYWAAATDLNALLSAQAAALRREDTVAFARADHAFHARIAAASGNALVDRFYAQIRPRLERLTCLAARSGKLDLARFLSDHRRLVTFLERADPVRYAVLLRAHVGLAGPRASGS